MTTQSKQRSLEQERAKAAWDCVQSASLTKQFVALARAAPADIQANGLGQTLAFWKAKKGEEHDNLYKAVADWVGRQLALKRDLLEWIIQDATTSEYRRATAEAMAFLSWVKRFAEAEVAE